jgi:hypothetical protein
MRKFFKNIERNPIWVLILLHSLLWTLLPAMVRNNLPLDSVECLAWGHEFQAGYSKHPPLSAWILEGIFVLSGKKQFAVYLASQLFVALALVFTWLLAREFLSPKKAVQATALLFCLYFYNYSAPEFNPNVVLLGIVAAFNFFAWKCLSSNKTIFWLGLAIVSALGILTKYSFAFHLIAFATLILLDKKRIKTYLYSYKPYLALGLFVVFLLPHLHWLVQNDFLPFTYIKESAEIHYRPQNHLLIPLNFLLTQLLFLLPVLLVFATVSQDGYDFKVKLKPMVLLDSHRKIEIKNQKNFLIIMNFVPLLLLMIPGIIAAQRIKDMWCYAMLSQIGILLFFFFGKPSKSRLCAIPNLLQDARFYKNKSLVGEPELTSGETNRHENQIHRKINLNKSRFWFLNCLFASLLAVGYFLGYWLKPDKYSLFNNQFAAQKVEKAWQECLYKNKIPAKPIEIIAGDMWIAGDISLAVANRPQVFIELDEKASGWISYKKFKSKGGILVWNANESAKEIPQRYQQSLRLAKIDSQKIINFGEPQSEVIIFKTGSNQPQEAELFKNKKLVGEPELSSGEKVQSETKFNHSSNLIKYNWQENFLKMRSANQNKIRLAFAVILPETSPETSPNKSPKKTSTKN